MMYAIEMRGISKSFNKVSVLQNVDFTLKAGEIKGLVGKNGAGKSTLLKIIQGIHEPTDGVVKIFDKEIPYSLPMSKRADMVSMIYQEFSLIPEMTVVQNIVLNNEPLRKGIIDEKYCNKLVSDFFEKYGIEINLNKRVKDLSTSDMQMVEICKAVIKKSKIILMDEPTAALEDEQTQKLFEIINKLKEDGISIVLITHHLKEIMKICDSVTVLRDGNIVLSKDTSELELTEIINEMLGEETNEFQKSITSERVINRTQPLLEVKNISSKKRLKNISFKVFPGEVVGIAGLKGSGRTELFNNLFGIDPIVQGEIIIEGNKVKIKNPKSALEHGIFLVPENRKTLGLSTMHSLYLNIQLPWMNNIKRIFLIDDKKGKEITKSYIEKLHIKTESINTEVKNLSGGNQQKVVIGKALATNPKVILLDDPTYGVDVHAKTEIMKIIEGFIASGGAVILASSDMEELIYNSNRILVMRHQEIIEEIVEKERITQETVTAAMQ
nr:sugar ABC transporter ATP-binding protein [Fredinandcohnia onubensis]